MKIVIELETDDLSILKLIAKAASVKPAPSNGQPLVGDTPHVLDNWSARKGALRLRAVAQPRTPA